MQTNQIKYYTRSDVALAFKERNKEQFALPRDKRDFLALFLSWRALLDEYEKSKCTPFDSLAWTIPAWADPTKRNAKEILEWINEQNYNSQFAKWSTQQRIDWCVAYFNCSNTVAKKVAGSI